MRGTAAPPQSRWPRSGWSWWSGVVLVVRGGPGWSWWAGTVTRWSGLSWRVTAAWSPPPGPGPWPGRERFVLQDVVPAPESPANNDILAYKAAVAALRTAVAGPGGRQSR